MLPHSHQVCEVAHRDEASTVPEWSTASHKRQANTKGRIMSYFNILAAASFQTADNGDIVWYPWGKRGKAYKVPTFEHRAEIQKQVKMPYIIFIISLLIYGITNPLVYKSLGINPIITGLLFMIWNL